MFTGEMQLLNPLVFLLDVLSARIGRTGRVGNTGRATSFVDMRADSGVMSQLVKVLVDAGQPVPDWMGGGGGRGGRPSGGFEWSVRGGRGGRSNGFGNGY